MTIATPHDARPEPATPGKIRILILGGGFGGAYCALTLQKKLRWDPDLQARVEIVLLDRNNYFIFYPLLIEAGVGSLQPSHVVVGLRRFCRHARFIQASVQDIDLEHGHVSYQVVGESDLQQMTYDHLVMAMGSVTLKPPVPGLKEYGYEMKSLADAVGLRDRVIQLLEQASAIDDPEKRRELLHLTVVGGSFTGIEVAGEFYEYMQEAAEFYPRLDKRDVRMTVLNRGDTLLKALDEKLGEYALTHLREKGVEVRLNASATAIHPESVELEDGTRLPARTVIWCAGIQPDPTVKYFDVPVDKHGYILCERDLRVKGFDNVWALGDAAVNPTAKGDPYPATAQAALRQGVICAKNILRELKDEETESADFMNEGMIAAFGSGDAVAEVMGVRLTGWIAWWMFRGVYLMKMPGLGRKLRVAADWTLDLFSGREFVQLGLHKIVKGGVEDHDAAADDVEAPRRSRGGVTPTAGPQRGSGPVPVDVVHDAGPDPRCGPAVRGAAGVARGRTAWRRRRRSCRARACRSRR